MVSENDVNKGLEKRGESINSSKGSQRGYLRMLRSRRGFTHEAEAREGYIYMYIYKYA